VNALKYYCMEVLRPASRLPRTGTQFFQFGAQLFVFCFQTEARLRFVTLLLLGDNPRFGLFASFLVGCSALTFRLDSLCFRILLIRLGQNLLLFSEHLFMFDKCSGALRLRSAR
jgi:hypothetical protein